MLWKQLGGKMCGETTAGASLGDGGRQGPAGPMATPQLRRLMDTSGVPAGIHLSDAKTRLYTPKLKGKLGMRGPRGEETLLQGVQGGVGSQH